MLYRKIEAPIREFLQGSRNKVLVVQGARQIGKSYIIRHVASQLFPNYIELNLVEDKEGSRLFTNVHTVEDFYLRLSLVAGDKMKGNRDNTIVFLDEIQEYPQFNHTVKILECRQEIYVCGLRLSVGHHLGLYHIKPCWQSENNGYVSS